MDSNTVKKLDYILSGYNVTYEEKQEIIELMQEYHQEQLKLYTVMQAKPEKADKDLLAIMATLIRSLSRVENNHPEILNEHDNRRLLKAKETLAEWCSIDPKEIPKPS